MTPDRTRWCELLVGLERVEVLIVVRHRDRLVVNVESTDRLMGCGACGTKVKDRDRVELADLPWTFPSTLARWWDRRAGTSAAQGSGGAPPASLPSGQVALPGSWPTCCPGGATTRSAWPTSAPPTPG
jgi:hypothetical protein